MRLSRTQTTFLLILTAAVAIVFIFNRGRGPAPAGTGSEPAANPRKLRVLVASSNTKRNWLNEVAAAFNRERRRSASGRLIVVEVDHVTSGGSMNAILGGSLQPVAWSPGDGSWVAQLEETWQRREGKAIASEACQPTVYAPLGFAMWRPMAETLGWPDTPIGWDTIVALAADPQGWAGYGRPEWGAFRFDHTHPAYANSGLLSMTGFVCGIAGKSEGLTAAEIYAGEVEEAMRALEQNTHKYGRQAPALLDLMAREGTAFLHAAAVPEADTARFNVERDDELSLPLAFIFPAGGTIWTDHPYCVLDNADWVDDEEAEAGRAFVAYLLAGEQQQRAVANYLRPLDDAIPIEAPLDLANGTDPSVTPATVPALPSPDADISNAVIDLFQTTKRKATIMVLIDVSGSMEGDKIRSARRATSEFLRRLDPADEVGVLIFADQVLSLSPPQPAGLVAEAVAQLIDALTAGGNTNMHGAVCAAVEDIGALQERDRAAGEARLYGIVLLSDGEDTINVPSESRMFTTCLPANPEADGIKIFPIAFGADADEAVLARIAAVTAGRLYSATPDSIDNVYLSISAEQ